jgi:hypothetical protein
MSTLVALPSHVFGSEAGGVRAPASGVTVGCGAAAGGTRPCSGVRLRGPSAPRSMPSCSSRRGSLPARTAAVIGRKRRREGEGGRDRYTLEICVADARRREHHRLTSRRPPPPGQGPGQDCTFARDLK